MTVYLDYSVAGVAEQSQPEREWDLKNANWHRTYVGGGKPEHWQLMGEVQLELLKSHGLQPRHNVLDIGCGSMRFGRLAVDYLDAGNYTGIDISERAVRAGLGQEMLPGWEYKLPKFVITDSFVMPPEKFSFITCHSVITHLGWEDVRACFRQALSVLRKHGKFFFTFNKVEEDHEVVSEVSYPEMTSYTWDMLETEIYAFGGKPNYIGEWGIPQNQRGHQMLAEVWR
jgi:SAM-dependent methyltransferase